MGATQDTYHFAFRRTWDKTKIALRPGLTLQAAIIDLETHTKNDTQQWIRTGKVWTSMNAGTQCCVEWDGWLDYTHLVPFEYEATAASERP